MIKALSRSVDSMEGKREGRKDEGNGERGSEREGRVNDD
jgi:hypothetical protein